jgi:hypothetical protein
MDWEGRWWAVDCDVKFATSTHAGKSVDGISKVRMAKQFFTSRILMKDRNRDLHISLAESPIRREYQLL